MKPFAALIKRHPFSSSGPFHPILEPDLTITDSTLAARHKAANEAIAEAFLEADAAATRRQRRFRRIRIALMVTAMLTSIFGALQAVWTDSFIPGLVVAIAGLLATSISRVESRQRPGETYLSARAKAEELRALHFRALGTELGDNPAELELRVADIMHPLEVAK